MYVMTEEERAERARTKQLHQKIRSWASPGDRYRNLVWAYVRGFKYRRVERSHHKQVVTGLLEGAAPGGVTRNPGYMRENGVWYYEHNMPSYYWLGRAFAELLPEFAGDPKRAEVAAFVWLKDRSGAVPAPPPRPKRVYKRELAEQPAAE